MIKELPTSRAFSDDNAALLWKAGLLHAQTFNLSAPQLDQLLTAARTEGAQSAPHPGGLRGWLMKRLAGRRRPATPPLLDPPAPCEAALRTGEEPQRSPVLEIDEDLQARIREIYAPRPDGK